MPDKNPFSSVVSACDDYPDQTWRVDNNNNNQPLAASSMDMLPRNAVSGTNIPSVAGSASGNANTQSTSFASLARELNRTGVTERAVRRPLSKSVVGSSTTNSHVKSVQTVRTVYVFVSRLEPFTTG